jgi:hypothetical protein
MSLLKLPLLAEFQQKVGESLLCTISCPSIIILESTLNWCIDKSGYGNFNHQYNFSPVHLLALLDVGNFKKVVHVYTKQPMKCSAIA